MNSFAWAAKETMEKEASGLYVKLKWNLSGENFLVIICSGSSTGNLVCIFV